jgi:hypothetical protein
MFAMQRLIPVVFLALLAAACATMKAAAPIDRPTLEVPPVPPRVVEAAPMPEVERIEPVADLPPAAAPAASKPRPPTAREQKPEAKPETPPAPDPAATAPPAAQAAPPPTLRTPATADAAAVERQIRITLDRARAGLKSIDYQQLTRERKKAYDEATDFIAGAETELKKSNFELAKSLAEKAEKYWKELQGR